MPVTGPNAPSSLIDDNSYGSVAWTNPGNAAVNDNIFATASLSTGTGSSHYLNVTNFGFAIPTSATILGVYVEISRQCGAGNIQDDRVRLVVNGAVQAVVDRASKAAWPSQNTYQAYGGITDLWGQALTPALVNGSNFGVALSAKGLAAGADIASVDNVRITVYYQLNKELISLTRALNSFNFILAVSQYPYIGTLITSVSDAIQKYCKRDFYSRFYDELYNGNGDRRLLLREYPLQSVQSVRYRPVTVLNVINTDQATNQIARVSVTSIGLQCSRVASGVPITETLLTYASNPTLNQMAAAVTALGNGWQGQIVGDVGMPGPGDYGLWPSSDLYVPPSYGDGTQSQGGKTARGVFAELKMHTYELQGFQWDPRGWLLRAIPYTDPELLHPEDLIWPVGVNNFRVQYTGGYSTIPEAVQEACAIWVSIEWFRTQRDPLPVRVSIPGAQTFDTGVIDPAKPPAAVASLLAPYRRFTVGVNQG